MSETELTYTIGKAGAAQIETHLNHVNPHFVPPLDAKVNLHTYALKLAEKAVNFEAWNNGLLVGLIAAYMNPTEGFAFITNVSVYPEWMGKKIAAVLLEQCKHYAKHHHLKSIRLEVNKNNAAAIHFYKKYNFTLHDEKEDSYFMQCTLS